MEFAAQHLGAQVDRHMATGMELLEMDETELADTYMSESFDVMRNMDDLLGEHTLHRLDRWVDFARHWGDTQAEKDYYEQGCQAANHRLGRPGVERVCRAILVRYDRQLL